MTSLPYEDGGENFQFLSLFSSIGLIRVIIFFGRICESGLHINIRSLRFVINIRHGTSCPELTTVNTTQESVFKHGLGPYDTSCLAPYAMSCRAPYVIGGLAPYNMSGLASYDMSCLVPYAMSCLAPYNMSFMAFYDMSGLTPYAMSGLAPKEMGVVIS